MGQPRSRRSFLLLPGLALGAVAAVSIRPIYGRRFTLELVSEVPKSWRRAELDRAVEWINKDLDAACFTYGVARRVDETVVIGLPDDEDPETGLDDDLSVVRWLLRGIEPLELRIAAIDHGLIDVEFRPPGRELLHRW